MSFSVNQTCLPSGVAAMFGQNALACSMVAITLCSATDTTLVRGWNDEQT